MLILIHTVVVIHFSVTTGTVCAVKPKLSDHKAWKVLNQFECGDSAADRIIGGSDALLGQFPWIARIGYVFPDDDEIDWMCGGALITDRHVVTAAHCIPTQEDEYKLSKIRLGEHDTRTNPDCELGICAPPVQDRLVKTIFKNEHFDQPPYHNDMAVIVLKSPVDLSVYVAPICLPYYDEELIGVHIGELVTAAGWGKMNMTTEERAEVLQVVALPIVEPKMCDSLGRDFHASNAEICAGAQFNKDACGGDSGGPLMKVHDTPDGPKTILVGVVSFGPTVCGIKTPGVYSSVPHFLPWILDQVIKK